MFLLLYGKSKNNSLLREMGKRGGEQTTCQFQTEELTQTVSLRQFWDAEGTCWSTVLGSSPTDSCKRGPSH